MNLNVHLKTDYMIRRFKPMKVFSTILALAMVVFVLSWTNGTADAQAPSGRPAWTMPGAQGGAGRPQEKLREKQQGKSANKASCRTGLVGKAPKILMLAGDPMEPAKGRLIRELGRQNGLIVDYVHMSTADFDGVSQSFDNYDLVIFDNAYMGAFMRLINPFRGVIAQTSTRVFQGPMSRDPSLIRCLDKTQSTTLRKYWMNGGPINFNRMMGYLKADVFKSEKLAVLPPINFPDQGLYHPDHPDRVIASLDNYLKWRPLRNGQKIVGVGIHRLRISDDMTVHIDQLVKRIEKAGAYPLVFFDPNDGEKNKPQLYHNGKLLPDVFVNFTGLYTDLDKQKAWNKKLDRVVMQGLTYTTGYIDEWRKDEEGYPFFRMSVHFTLSEISGRVDPTLVAAKRRSDDKFAEIPEQMQALVDRALKYANLRHKPNKDKKVAFVVWNSPEGEENFSASYLNVPVSLSKVFHDMRAAGYDAPEINDLDLIETVKKLIKPYYRTVDDKMLRGLLKDGLAEKFPVAEYKAFLKTLPQSVQDNMKKSWGPAENSYLNLKENGVDYVVMPRAKFGNIYLLPQPLRGGRRDAEKDIFHDKKVPLHHGYRSVYYKLAHGLDIDAIVHFGTHGSQEWLGGKERAPWVYDDTQSTIGSIPVVYPYNVANTGEALIARRRGRATIISHNSPPFAPAGLYGELIKLHELMHQMHELDEGKVKENVKAQMVKLTLKLKLDKDIGSSEAEAKTDWEAFEEKLHEYLESVAGMPQPLGVHTFGDWAETDHILMTILQIMGPEFTALYGIDHGHYLLQDYKKLSQTKPYLDLKSALVEERSLSEFPEKLRAILKDGKRHYANFLGEQEMEHLLAALSAGHIPTGTGNDPLRNPDAVPTGRNTYGFDPRKIPTKAAWEAGKELVTGLIANYKRKHGVAPDKLAFSMWSTETFKHFGVVESQILYALGVRPKWNRRDDVVGVELIPAKELGRPRIDTILSITGLYRDNLPQVMNLIQNAINMVAKLNEKNNHVFASAQKIKAGLIKKGIDPEKAEIYSTVRLFGVESGEYGTDLPEASLASGSWEGDEKLAKLFINRMGTMFGTGKGTRNVKLDNIDLFTENLRGVKAAVLSRSTNNHGLLSLDHTFEYLGGLGMTVRYLDGKTPELYVADLRNTRNFKTQTAADFIATELRSRYYHPRWIEEMKKEKYAGANEILNVINNTWGWDVMDPEAVRDDQWQEMFEIYTQDKLKLGLDEWFRDVHPSALAQISERMLEAVRKGYWDASEETQKALVEEYISIAETHDLFTNNQKFKDYLNEKATGYGLVMAALKSAPSDQPKATNPETRTEVAKAEPLPQPQSETVEGVKLEKQPPPQSADEPFDEMKLAAILAAIFMLGFVYEGALGGLSVGASMARGKGILG